MSLDMYLADVPVFSCAGIFDAVQPKYPPSAPRPPERFFVLSNIRGLPSQMENVVAAPIRHFVHAVARDIPICILHSIPGAQKGNRNMTEPQRLRIFPRRQFVVALGDKRTAVICEVLQPLDLFMEQLRISQIDSPPCGSRNRCAVSLCKYGEMPRAILAMATLAMNSTARIQ
jgi:hypothetical protein